MIKFYKGKKENYNEQTHSDGLFFTTDTFEIFVDGESYGKSSGGSLTEDVIIAGGPLADNLEDLVDEWPAGWTSTDGNKIIPKGKSMLEVFEGLFLKVDNGTVTWDEEATWDPYLALPTVTLNSPKDSLEVGSTVTCKVTSNFDVLNNVRFATCEATYGYFNSLDDSWNAGDKRIEKTGSKSGNGTLSYTWRGSSVENFQSESTSLTIGLGDNKFVATQSGINVSVEALPDTTVYASTNTKQILQDKPALFSGDENENKSLTSTGESKTITGYYRYFIGECDPITEDNLTSDLVRSLTSKKSGAMTTTQIAYTAEHNPTKGFIVACPATHVIDYIKDDAAVFEGGFTLKTMNVKDLGGSDVSYNVYYCNNTGSNKAVYKYFKFKLS